MGLSASQVRLLTLTKRLSDLEYQAQQISNSKIRLSSESEQISQAYSDSLNKTKFTIMGSATSDGNMAYCTMNYNNLTGSDSPLLSQYCIADSNGNVVVPQDVADNFKKSSDVNAFLQNEGVITADGKTTGNTTYYTNLYNRMQSGFTIIEAQNQNSSDWLQSQIKMGNIGLEKFTDGAWKSSSWYANTDIVEESDDSNTAKAEAVYDLKMTEVKSKDNSYDLKLKNIDTEHTSIQTEMDSVKKVIDKNIERTFKIFNA